MEGYRLALSGERGPVTKGKDQNKRRKAKRKVDEVYFESPRGKNLLRRLDRNFYANLAKHINHKRTVTETSHVEPAILEEFVNRYSPKVIRWLARYLPVERIASLNRKLRFATESKFDPVMLDYARSHFHMLIQAANTYLPEFQRDLFEGSGDMVRPRTETTLPSSRPSKMLRRVTGTNVNSHLKHEARLQGFLTLIAASLYSYARNIELIDRLSDTQDVLSAHFFDGEIGEAVTHTTYALYDTKTNRVIGIDGRFMPINFPYLSPEEYQWKEHKYQVRKIKDMKDTFVLWDPDVKDWAAAFEKILERVLEKDLNEGENPLKTYKIRDMIRMRIVVMGTTSAEVPQVGEVADRFKETLKQYDHGPKFEERTSLTNKYAQDDNLNYLRLYITYGKEQEDIISDNEQEDNKHQRVEVIIFDEATYLTSEHYIGTEPLTDDNKDYLFKQKLAHSLFKLFRKIKQLPVIMPPEVPGYNHGNINILQSAFNSYNFERERLSKVGNVDEATSRMLTERNLVSREERVWANYEE